MYTESLFRIAFWVLFGGLIVMQVYVAPPSSGNFVILTDYCRHKAGGYFGRSRSTSGCTPTAFGGR